MEIQLLLVALVLSTAGAFPLHEVGKQLQRRGECNFIRPSSGRSLTVYRDNTTTIGISDSLLESFELFANFTAASYCPANENSTSNTLITCPSGVCPLVEADNVISLAEFGGS
jgi:Lipase 3 N-terminal region